MLTMSLAAFVIHNFASPMETAVADRKLLSARVLDPDWAWTSSVVGDDFAFDRDVRITRLAFFSSAFLAPVIEGYDAYIYPIIDGVPSSEPIVSATDLTGTRRELWTDIIWHMNTISLETVAVDLSIPAGEYVVVVRPVLGVDAWGEAIIEHTVVGSGGDGVWYCAAGVDADGVVGTWHEHHPGTGNVMMSITIDR